MFSLSNTEKYSFFLTILTYKGQMKTLRVLFSVLLNFVPQKPCIVYVACCGEIITTRNDRPVVQ